MTLDELTGSAKLPKMVKIRQNFDRPMIEDIPAEIRSQIEKSGVLARIKAGDTVALTAGSRQVNNFPEILKVTIEILKEHGAEPFVVPAMGSHGGATAEGQRIVLEGLGVTEEAIGAPIKSSMETVTLGYTDSGLRVELDKNASEADAIFVMHRVKPHTSFNHTIESGLLKMITIGLGKQCGADSCHNTKIINLGPRVVEMAEYAIAHCNIVGGLAVLENAYDDTAEIHCLLAEDIIKEEPTLLIRAKEYLAQFLFKPFDLLVVDEIGKNISGTGMDPNIIKRFSTPDIKEDPITQIISILDLSEKAHGNGGGMGLADFSTRRLYNKVDLYETYPNPLTARVPLSSKIPLIMDNDRQAIKAGLRCCMDVEEGNERVVHIHNTLCMSEFYVSENMIPEMLAHPNIDVIGEAEEYKFDENGNLF